jgi:beta-glucanase (GH16 family)
MGELRTYTCRVFFLSFLMVFLFLPRPAASEPPPGKGRPSDPPPSAPSFSDNLTIYDTSLWSKADGWANGSPFDNGWSASAIQFGTEGMAIELSDTPNNGEPYTSGELRTTEFYGYGCYEVGMKPVPESGVITAFFTFAGPYDTPRGGNGKHNEIDIEFLGYDTTIVQVNYWTNDDAYSNGQEHIVSLGFDAADDFHDYAIKWDSTGIIWYVDEVQVHAVVDSPNYPTPKITDSTHKIMMNMWAVDETASGWAGSFDYPGAPLTAAYDWVQFTEGEDCVIGEDSEPPLPSPDSGDMHIASITLALASRDRQAVATVQLVDGNGEAVTAAEVQGEWSGLVTGGDSSRTTDNDGQALFYSRRNRDATGTFTFCVTNVTKDDFVYAPAEDLETCGSVSK